MKGVEFKSGVNKPHIPRGLWNQHAQDISNCQSSPQEFVVLSFEWCPVELVHLCFVCILPPSIWRPRFEFVSSSFIVFVVDRALSSTSRGLRLGMIDPYTQWRIVTSSRIVFVSLEQTHGTGTFVLRVHSPPVYLAAAVRVRFIKFHRVCCRSSFEQHVPRFASRDDRSLHTMANRHVLKNCFCVS